MVKHTIQQKQLQVLLNNTKSFKKIIVNNMTISKQNGRVFLISPMNNVITYDFSLDLNQQINSLNQMDLDNNTFCQDCTNIKNCHSCSNCINCTNCEGLDYERNISNVKRDNY